MKNGYKKNIKAVSYTHLDVYKRQLHSMNMVPCGYHRYYYMKQAMLEHAIEEFNEGGTRAEQMRCV